MQWCKCHSLTYGHLLVIIFPHQHLLQPLLSALKTLKTWCLLRSKGYSNINPDEPWNVRVSHWLLDFRWTGVAPSEVYLGPPGRPLVVACDHHQLTDTNSKQQRNILMILLVTEIFVHYVVWHYHVDITTNHGCQFNYVHYIFAQLWWCHVQTWKESTVGRAHLNWYHLEITSQLNPKQHISRGRNHGYSRSPRMFCLLLKTMLQAMAWESWWLN